MDLTDTPITPSVTTANTWPVLAKLVAIFFYLATSFCTIFRCAFVNLIFSACFGVGGGGIGRCMMGNLEFPNYIETLRIVYYYVVQVGRDI